MPGQGATENKLPVFTTPQQQITVFADDPLSYKQILTIYNPYEFSVKFRSKYVIKIYLNIILFNVYLCIVFLKQIM